MCVSATTCAGAEQFTREQKFRQQFMVPADWVLQMEVPMLMTLSHNEATGLGWVLGFSHSDSYKPGDEHLASQNEMAVINCSA